MKLVQEQKIVLSLQQKRLSADVQTFAPSSSSLTKGETIIDTAITYSAMGADTLVIRHSSSYITFEIAKKLDAINAKTSVLNAGDGLHSHPSQGLLDIYTLIKFFSQKTLNPVGFKFQKNFNNWRR